MAVHRIHMLIAAASVLLSLAACNGRRVYSAYHHVPEGVWDRGDTLSFRIDTLRADAVYQFALGLRSTISYPYTSIWMAVEREFTPPHTLWRDTVECQLVDSTTRRVGKGIYMYQYEIALPAMSLRQGQSGRVRVVHLMQRESLPGIYDVGVFVTR